ncbi:MAG: cytochrome c peroxidase [Woeseiaceae bacterium]|nr:cytochrome c peroxidase [Woeseiaceae bacterium]
MKKAAFSLLVFVTVAAAIGGSRLFPGAVDDWSDAEIATLRSLWIGSLPELPPDPGNAVANDADAARFGQALFFSKALSPSGAIACATCHRPELRFTDGMRKGRGVGESRRNTMSIVGSAYSPWQYWDGRRDSQWAQALSPIEDPAEHGGSREHAVRAVAADSDLRRQYEDIFGPLPDPGAADRIDTTFANLGKAIAAYERLIMPAPARFDAYVEAVLAGDRHRQQELFSIDERAGLHLFVGKAQCTQCHNGPLLTNHEFHNTGLLSLPGEVPDKGRALGVRQVLADPFNCLGRFSDAPPDACAELEFARSGFEVLGAFRTPSLRNLENTQPYMHKGQMFTLAEVLDHYNDAPPAMIGHNEAKPLGLSRTELRQLEAFLETLAAPLATPEALLGPPEN